MSNIIDIARDTLLTPAGITDNQVEKVLGDVMGHKVDAADLYFQSVSSEAWSLEDGIVNDGSYSIDRGVGVRAIAGEKTGFAYSDDILLPALDQAADAAGSIARLGGSGSIKVWSQVEGSELYQPVDPLGTLTDQDKIDLLQRVDTHARKQDQRIKQVFVNLSGSYEVMLVMASDGHMAADIRPMVRLNVSVIAEENGRREQGGFGGGGRTGYDCFLKGDKALQFADEAVHQAIVNLDSVAAPAGMMPVVLGPGWPGVLLHEAVGHGLEGDFNRKGSSVFAGRIGERVAAPGVTVVDDGTLPERRGSLNVDDEGSVTECTTLIENGILKGYMQDKLNAKLTGTKSTGNGRRESYAHVPMPRMTNTYMLAGSYDPQEIIGSVKKGIYAVTLGGGQVDITSGKFVFSVSEAYLIEDGKLTQPVKGATLIGDGPDVLTKVSMIGNDLKLDEGVGTCGKEGQQVPVGVGQPTLLVDELTVGGTQG